MALYITQLLYLWPGKEAMFEAFELVALPLLSKYRGELLLRVRPDPSSVIHAAGDIPYEVHVVKFEGEEDFYRFSQDPERQSVLELKDQAVRHVLVIKGV